ncbi:MAG: hypothetical protein ACFFAO_00335 [Candidatus Hermodarchaeota archaeon]
MILQNSFDWIQFSYVVLGAFFGTIFGLLAKYLIEKINFFREKKNIKKEFKKLYDLLSGNYYPDLPDDVYYLITDNIGINFFHDVLNMRETLYYDQEDNQFCFSSREFSLHIDILPGNSLQIFSKGLRGFNYSKPEENNDIRQNFLKYFTAKCKQYFKKWNLDK